MQLSTLVILYGSSIAESSTLQSLLACELEQPLNLHIWNNGPSLLEPQDITHYLTKVQAKKNIKIEIYQDDRNLGLSKLYNFIINKRNFDFFIPLDQDSILPTDFFLTLTKHQSLSLILPMIESKGIIKFPYYVKQGAITHEGAVEINRVTSINSGMAISAHLVDIFHAHSLSVFDERFAFYGVDTAFFLNLWEIYKKSPEITCGCFGKIQHSLSMDEEASEKPSYSRDLEYLYYFILYRLHYKKRSKLSVLFHVMGKIIKGRVKDCKSFKKVILCIFQGKHPRAFLEIKQPTTKH